MASCVSITYPTLEITMCITPVHSSQAWVLWSPCADHTFPRLCASCLMTLVLHIIRAVRVSGSHCCSNLHINTTQQQFEQPQLGCQLKPIELLADLGGLLVKLKGQCVRTVGSRGGGTWAHLHCLVNQAANLWIIVEGAEEALRCRIVANLGEGEADGVRAVLARSAQDRQSLNIHLVRSRCFFACIMASAAGR